MFFGNLTPINISSIRIIESSKKYEDVFGALCLLDQCLSDEKPESKYQSGKHIKILNKLFNYKLDKTEEKEFDEYVLDTFRCYVSHKQELVISLDHMDYVKNKDRLKVIFYSLEKQDKIRSNDDYTNLMKKELFTIFTKVERMSITVNEYWTLSIYQLLIMIESTSLQQVKITMKIKSKKTWLNVLWESSSQELIDKANMMNFNIRFKKNIRWNNDEIIITKN